ncbi:hypothetical protein OEZ86_005967 [Tetradesmus obliquus]|nr:hypothetical protein OEZ86_005967 [Tetradesmus obliquus]
MSLGAVKRFLQQVKVDVSHDITQQQQLLELAKAATKLWEAQRVLRYKTPQQLAGQQAVFAEAFKALQNAQQLVPALSS